jgi:hypothetical protein
VRGWWVAILLLAGCTARIGDPSGSSTGGPNGPQGPNGPTGPGPIQPGVIVPLGPGIERLSNREALGAIASLFPEVTIDGGDLPPDARQSDFTRNRAQIVDPVLALAYQSIAVDVAEAMTTDHRDRFDACMRAAPPSSSCVDMVLAELGARAFRRPLEATEAAALRAIYEVGLTEVDAWSGLRLVIEALLQSPSFLYQRQIGDGDQLSSIEIAEALAFLFTGRAPDPTTTELGESGALLDPSTRETEARRLYALHSSRGHLAWTILEWLKIDRLEELAKDANTYPGFFALRSQMADEARDLVEGSLASEVDTLEHLLTDEASTAERELAAMYGAAPRPGILTRAAFLAVYASPTESSPVKRGNGILKKLLCVELPIPTELMINIVPPAPDPSLTTRERYAQHSSDMACAQCHLQIDPLGFAFEGFDGIGEARTTENSRPIDTRVDVTSAAIAGAYPGPNELIRALAASDDVDTCFARNVFRYALATRSASLEAALLAEWSASGAQTELLEILVTFVRSEWFAKRKAG